MKFPAQPPKVFTKESIEALPPGKMGCYGLAGSHGGWIYVGKGDIRQSLLNHLSGDNPCIVKNHPTHWVEIVTGNMDAVEEALISELNPTCNRKAD
jgi:hypothetical protein